MQPLACSTHAGKCLTSQTQHSSATARQHAVPQPSQSEAHPSASSSSSSDTRPPPAMPHHSPAPSTQAAQTRSNNTSAPAGSSIWQETALQPVRIDTKRSGRQAAAAAGWTSLHTGVGPCCCGISEHSPSMQPQCTQCSQARPKLRASLNIYRICRCKAKAQMPHVPPYCLAWPAALFLSNLPLFLRLYRRTSVSAQLGLPEKGHSGPLTVPPGAGAQLLSSSTSYI